MQRSPHSSLRSQSRISTGKDSNHFPILCSFKCFPLKAASPGGLHLPSPPRRSLSTCPALVFSTGWRTWRAWRWTEAPVGPCTGFAI